MKNIYTYVSLVIAMLLASCSVTNYPQSNYASESSDITYQQFYNDLSPYGDWVDYQNYGYVWIPNEIGFRPYYNNGHWIYSDYGWTWVSNYNWGWAPFHYGRWLHDYAYGWMWVPGYEWAPAWVSWRSGGDYYGWAPLGPGMDVNSNYGSNIPYDNWAFVPRRYINNPRINNYYVNRQQNVTIINNTTIVNNTRVINNNNVYITGPSASDVERDTHQKINPVRIEQRNKPGGERLTGNKLTLYRPVVKDVPQPTRTFKPAKLSNLNELKLRRERTEGANNKFTPNDNNRKELNPVDRVLEPANPQKNNPPLILNRQKEVGPPQKTNNDQQTQPNPGNIKNENNNQDNERILREKQFQQRTQQQKAENDRLLQEKQNQQNLQQQKAENDRLIQEKQNQQRIQQQKAENDRLVQEKQNQQRIQQNADKKNEQFNNRRIQNPNNNQQPQGKNNPPANIRNLNRPNIKPQINNVQPIQRNLPANRPPLNNQPPGVNDNQRIISPAQGDPQKKEKKE